MLVVVDDGGMLDEEVGGRADGDSVVVKLPLVVGVGLQFRQRPLPHIDAVANTCASHQL